MDLANGTFTLTQSEFTLTKTVHLNPAHVFVFEQPEPYRPSLTIDPDTGRVAGRVTLEIGTTVRTVTLQGIINQANDRVSGFFLDGAGGTGAFEVQP